MGPVCNIMHEVGSLEAAMFSSDDRDCLMDDPNCPCSLLPLLFGSLLNLVELSLWTRATLQEHVLSPPSLIYIRLPAIDLWQSFTSHTRTLDSSPLILLSPSAPDLHHKSIRAHWFMKERMIWFAVMTSVPIFVHS